MLAPLMLAVAETAALPATPFLLALAMASNTGSLATFTGNPQNMLIQGSSNLPYAEFTAYMALPAIASTAIAVAVLLFMYRQELTREPLKIVANAPAIDPLRMSMYLGVLGLVVVGFLLNLPMGWTALAGASASLVLSGRTPRPLLEKIDYVLLLFFGCLFVVVHGVNAEGWVERIRILFDPLLGSGGHTQTLGFAGLSLLASNLFSNVPYVMFARHWVPTLSDPLMGWHVLALASTLAGNLTLVGSVANLIVFEAARGKAEVSFWSYLKAGVPVTLLSLAAGLAILIAEHALMR
jgi:Na+/H+ antiporter NhaD/arsenite permease-like protein